MNYKSLNPCFGRTISCKLINYWVCCSKAQQQEAAESMMGNKPPLSLSSLHLAACLPLSHCESECGPYHGLWGEWRVLLGSLWGSGVGGLCRLLLLLLLLGGLMGCCWRTIRHGELTHRRLGEDGWTLSTVQCGFSWGEKAQSGAHTSWDK